MTAVHEDQILTTDEFERIARVAERESEGVRFEFVGGRLGVKAVPDGDHDEILAWLLTLLMPLSPALFLYVSGRGLKVGGYREGRARPDGVLAPRGTFTGAGEWASPDAVAMVVEVTSQDSDSNRRDRVDKPVAYGQEGIPIYLLIDRDAAKVVVYSAPNDEGYQDTHSYAFGREITLPDPVGITFDSEPLKGWID